MEVTGGRVDDARAEPGAVRLGVGREARPVILDPQPPAVLAELAVLDGRVGVSHGLGDELAHDQPDRDRLVDGQPDGVAGEHDAGERAGRDPLHLGEQPVEGVVHVDRDDVSRAVEPTVDPGHRLDPLGRLTERLLDRLVVAGAGVHPEQRRDELERVGDAVVHLAQKNRLLLGRQLEPGQALARRLFGGFLRAL